MSVLLVMTTDEFLNKLNQLVGRLAWWHNLLPTSRIAFRIDSQY